MNNSIKRWDIYINIYAAMTDLLADDIRCASPMCSPFSFIVVAFE